jgi:hypothetical protein
MAHPPLRAHILLIKNIFFTPIKRQNNSKERHFNIIVLNQYAIVNKKQNYPWFSP